MSVIFFIDNDYKTLWCPLQEIHCIRKIYIKALRINQVK